MTTCIVVDPGRWVVADPWRCRHLEPILFSEGRGTSPGAVEGTIALHVQKDIGQGLDLALLPQTGWSQGTRGLQHQASFSLLGFIEVWEERRQRGVMRSAGRSARNNPSD